MSASTRTRTGTGQEAGASLLSIALTMMNPIPIEEASGARIPCSLVLSPAEALLERQNLENGFAAWKLPSRQRSTAMVSPGYTGAEKRSFIAFSRVAS